MTGNRILRLAIVFSILSFATSCFAPPVLFEPTGIDVDRAVATYPRTHQTVTLRSEGEPVLVGIFVPSEEGAPVVLQFLESSASVVSDTHSYGPLTRELADLGFASLLFDYAGIGRSEGTRSAANFERDTFRIWEEALRRAGGDSRRVIVRATSIGSIPLSLLLAAGAEPGGVVIIAPVLAESVVGHWADFLYGPLGVFVAWAFFRDATDVDLVEAIAAADVTPIVLAASDDFLMSEGEIARMRAAVEERGGTWNVVEGNHLTVAFDGHWILLPELEYYASRRGVDRASQARLTRLLGELDSGIARRFPPGSARRDRLERLAANQRFGEPAFVAAAALGNEDVVEATRLLWSHHLLPLPGDIDFDSRVAAFDLNDPAGRLKLEWVREASRFAEFMRVGGAVFLMNPGGVRKMTNAVAAGAPDLVSTLTLRLGIRAFKSVIDPGDIWRALADYGAGEADRRRLFARVLLKAARIPDRIAMNDDGAVALEYWSNGGWNVMDLTPFDPGSDSLDADDYVIKSLAGGRIKINATDDDD